MTEQILEVRDVHLSFGGVKCLTAVSFAVDRGTVLGLIGPNGAGKTTIFNVISGIYRADAGSVWLDGEEISGRTPAHIARLGVARTFQVARTFNDMTVEENLRVGLVRERGSRAAVDRRVAEMLLLAGLERHAHLIAGSLPDGQRKLLEIVRANMIEPKLLILDEPFAGVSPDVIDMIIDLIRSLAARGVTCLAISHDVASLPRLCRDILVLVGGQVMTRGSIDDVKADPRVVEAYLGA
jgi:branched-chain amino acid transport system ATP-binding protein